MGKGESQNLYHRPPPYGLDESAGGAQHYVTTNQRDFVERDLSAAHYERVSAIDFSGRPLPYSLDSSADSLDRFITTNRTQFVARQIGEAQPERRVAYDFKGRPVPFAFDVNHDSADRYETSYSRQFQPESFDLAEARAPRAAHADYHGRPLPYAAEPELDTPDKWVSASKRQFVARDLKEARPSERVTHDQEYNVVTFEPIAKFALPNAAPRGRTAALGIVRPSGVDPMPASRLTEKHFLHFMDTFHPNPLTAHAYASAQMMREDVQRHKIDQPPWGKFLQPVTESQRIGWQWQPGHDGYDQLAAPPPDPDAKPPTKEAYHGRKASYITKQKESMLLNGRTAFSGNLAQNGPARAII
jgi:hypothetical protein